MAFDPKPIMSGRATIPAGVLGRIIGRDGPPLPDFESARRSVRSDPDDEYVGQLTEQEIEEHHREHHPELWRRMMERRQAAAAESRPMPWTSRGRRHDSHDPEPRPEAKPAEPPIHAPGDGSRFEDL